MIYQTNPQKVSVLLKAVEKKNVCESYSRSQCQGTGSAVSQFEAHIWHPDRSRCQKEGVSLCWVSQFSVRIRHRSLAKRRITLNLRPYTTKKTGLIENNSPQTSVKAKRRRRYWKKEREWMNERFIYYFKSNRGETETILQWACIMSQDVFWAFELRNGEWWQFKLCKQMNGIQLQPWEDQARASWLASQDQSGCQLHILSPINVDKGDCIWHSS